MMSEESYPKSLYRDAFECHHQKKDVDKAIVIYEKIVELYPESGEANWANAALDMISKQFPEKRIKSVKRDLLPLEQLCGLLHIPIFSSHEAIERKYHELREMWEPRKHMNDPDKYFSAQQVYKQLEEA